MFRRQFATAAALRSLRIPTLGDVTHSPQNSAAFRERLKAYRGQLAAQKKAASQAAADANVEHHKGGIVKSILYGSEKGQREEAEMEQSYSTVLARGKYVHAIEFQHVKPDAHAEYVELVGNTYPDIAADKANNCHLVGSWKTEIGDGDTFGSCTPSLPFPSLPFPPIPRPPPPAERMMTVVAVVVVV